MTRFFCNWVYISTLQELFVILTELFRSPFISILLFLYNLSGEGRPPITPHSISTLMSRINLDKNTTCKGWGVGIRKISKESEDMNKMIKQKNRIASEGGSSEY